MARSILFLDLTATSELPEISLDADVISLKCRVSLWAPLISSPRRERPRQSPTLMVAPHNSSNSRRCNTPETGGNFASEGAASIPPYVYMNFF